MVDFQSNFTQTIKPMPTIPKKKLHIKNSFSLDFSHSSSNSQINSPKINSKYCLFLPEKTACAWNTPHKLYPQNSVQVISPIKLGYSKYKMKNLEPNNEKYKRINSAIFLGNLSASLSPQNNITKQIPYSKIIKENKFWKPGETNKYKKLLKYNKNDSPVNMAKQMGRDLENPIFLQREIQRKSHAHVINSNEPIFTKPKIFIEKAVMQLVPSNYHPNNVQQDLYKRKQLALEIFHKTRSTTSPYLGYLKVSETNNK